MWMLPLLSMFMVINSEGGSFSCIHATSAIGSSPVGFLMLFTFKFAAAVSMVEVVEDSADVEVVAAARPFCCCCFNATEAMIACTADGDSSESLWLEFGVALFMVVAEAGAGEA